MSPKVESYGADQKITSKGFRKRQLSEGSWVEGGQKQYLSRVSGFTDSRACGKPSNVIAFQVLN